MVRGAKIDIHFQQSMNKYMWFLFREGSFIPKPHIKSKHFMKYFKNTYVNKRPMTTPLSGSQLFWDFNFPKQLQTHAIGIQAYEGGASAHAPKCIPPRSHLGTCVPSSGSGMALLRCLTYISTPLAG